MTADAPCPIYTVAATAAEFFETPRWAADAILERELLTSLVYDPCAGRGVLGDAARAAGYNVHEADLHEWPGQRPAIATRVDFFADPTPPIVQTGRPLTILMNPPFSRADAFVRRAIDIGARKIVMFQRLAFLEAARREALFADHPPARIWLCASRATCWRGDLPAATRERRSTPTPHAWFVWERLHRGAMTMHQIYRQPQEMGFDL